MTLAQIGLLAVAGVGAGVVGSTAGLASLISYPTLLLIGLSPVTANVTNTVALIGSSIGSVSGSRLELRGQGPDIRRWLPLALLGGTAGAALLLVLPSTYFEDVVPFLVAGASGLLLVGPRLRALRARQAAEPGGLTAPRRGGLAMPIGMLLTCVYGGYFGAAAGVMLLALLLLGTGKTLPVANAVKNLLLGSANAIAAVGFIVFSDVRWSAVIPLAIGCMIGGRIGPVIVRRLPPDLLRWVIALAGFGLAIKLWLG